ncbi:MAG: ATP-grasp domain-containing protein [Kofleriaceae bacterium]
MPRPRVLLVTTATSYNAAAFLEAAARLDVEVVLASDRCHQLDDLFAFPPASLVIDLAAPQAAVEVIVAESRREADRPIVAAISAGGESAALVATMAARALGLPHNAIEAVEAARDKRRMRELLAAAGVSQPRFAGTDLDEPSGRVAARIRAELGFPCVIKPRLLSASRGVIRVDDDLSLARGLTRLRTLLARPDHLEMDLHGDGSSRSILIEEFVPGAEVALEGVLDRGTLRTLALFDKPDPLDGPFFEETIYVTPSRQPAEVQRAIEQVTAAAAHAMGLHDGPVHAELRLPPRGPVAPPRGPVVIEVAARSIGGLCSRVLRFGTGLSLEDVLVRHALGHDIGALPREHAAAGAMMIPIPRAGVLKAVDGVELARAVAGIDDVVITQDLDRQLVPLPEGASYLGFVFAHGTTPEAAEASLRAAHAALRFTIVPMLPVR